MSTKPEAGQWWFNCTTFGCDAKRNGVRIQDVLSDTQVLIERVQGCWEVWPRDELSGGWHHEPRCTGWDWVVPQPAEDPDEWVVQDGVPPRRGKDQFRYVRKDGLAYPWEYCYCDMQWPHGEWVCCERLEVRCRRRDLPKEPEQQQQPTSGGYKKALEIVAALPPEERNALLLSGMSHNPTPREPTPRECQPLKPVADNRVLGSTEPQPQKTRVRLWIEGPTKMVMCRDKAPYGDWQELHHDSDGFYVENQR